MGLDEVGVGGCPGHRVGRCGVVDRSGVRCGRFTCGSRAVAAVPLPCREAFSGDRPKADALALAPTASGDDLLRIEALLALFLHRTLLFLPRRALLLPLPLLFLVFTARFFVLSPLALGLQEPCLLLSLLFDAHHIPERDVIIILVLLLAFNEAYTLLESGLEGRRSRWRRLWGR